METPADTADRDMKGLAALHRYRSHRAIRPPITCEEMETFPHAPNPDGGSDGPARAVRADTRSAAVSGQMAPNVGHGLMQNSKAKMKTSNLEEIRLVVTDRRPTQESGEGRTETIKMKRF